MKKIIIVGGGASGFFTAINAKETNPELDITILEKSKSILQKVKISGGGRCNVTHACFEPKPLTQHYPRGEKELLGPFHKFMSGDVFEWFESRGVPLKIEEDGRVFPKANSSSAIINCFTELAKKLNIKIITNSLVTDFYPKNNLWEVVTKSEVLKCNKLVIASGSSKNIWSISEKLNHSIIHPVPSLFTFKIKDPIIENLSGIAVNNASIKIKDTKLETTGPILITHWGLSGPATLKLSAFGARILSEKNYQYQIEINWLSKSRNETIELLENFKKELSNKQVNLKSPFPTIPKRLWEKLLIASEIKKQNWAELNKQQILKITNQLNHSIFNANGKSTFKEEFVTAGGINLKEINFKNFESKLFKNLYFVGEVLNIDAVTGGFNFQNAWTSGYICSQNISK